MMKAASTAGGRAALLGTAPAFLAVVLHGSPTGLVAVAGLWLLFVAPTLLWFGLATRVVSTRDGAALLALGLTVVSDMLVGLLVNTFLPLLGVGRPLERIPLAIAFSLALLLIAVSAPAPVPRQNRESPGGSQPRESAADRRRHPGLIPVAILGVLAIVLAVAGAIRLNNGLGGGVSLAALVVIAAVVLLLMVRHQVMPDAVVESGIFLASAALLLVVSLRGWFITGHDIQSEYKIFTAALDAGRWLANSAATAYNACLSINILPVSVVRLTGIPGIYVFKAVLPVLFAVTPVLVYRSVRNVAAPIIALLSAIYFMLFPTFYTDMPYLARQEVALVLLGCMVVVITDPGRPVARSLVLRRAAVLVLMTGIVLSHYSTTYVMVATFALAYAVDQLWRVADRYRRKRAQRRLQDESRPSGRGFITWWTVAIGAAMAALWAGPATHSGDQVRATVSSTIFQFLHPEHSQSASDTSYSLFGGSALSMAEALSRYRAETLAQTSGERASGGLLPLGTVDRFPTVAVEQPKLPLTPVGRALGHIGVNVAAVNNGVRLLAARLLQVLLLIGLAVTIWARRSRPIPLNRTLVTLAFGSVIVIGVLTVLPQLSVDYGVLRAFQQGLFFCSPFIVAASLWLLGWTWRRGVPMSCALALVLLLDLTGVVPTLTGGYPAQLQLANAGQYYDLYYTHAPEIAAAKWVQAQLAEQQLPAQSRLQTDGFTFSRQQTNIHAPSVRDIYPTLIGKDTYVLVGTSTVRLDRVTVDYRGNLVTYLYPSELLDITKNKVYSNEGAEVFR